MGSFIRAESGRAFPHYVPVEVPADDDWQRPARHVPKGPRENDGANTAVRVSQLLEALSVDHDAQCTELPAMANRAPPHDHAPPVMPIQSALRLRALFQRRIF